MPIEKCVHPQCNCLDYCMAKEPYESAEPLKCSECGDTCKAIEEELGYSGTHCTNGKNGIHKTGRYISDCCLADCSP